MNSCVPDESTVQRLIAEIEASKPRPHHASMLAVTERLIPDCPCRFALTRGSWYRSGGLIGAAGERVADNLEDWVARELADCGDDLGEFMDRHADLTATRHNGRTHYFVAPYSRNPMDFLQLEVEEMQEVLDRRLWDAASPPLDAQELTEPSKPASVPAQPGGAPYYRFRRLTDIRQATARLHSPIGGVPDLIRFMQEWAASRAGQGTHFSEHWIVALRDHQDRYNNLALSATPVSRHTRALKPFHWNSAWRGLDAARQLQAFDRAAGYPGAWYFHLVSSGITPRDVAFAVMQDIASGFGYLSDAETLLLQGWMREPYSV